MSCWRQAPQGRSGISYKNVSGGRLGCAHGPIRPCRRKLIKKKYGIDVDWICDRDDVKAHHKIAFYISVEAEAYEEVVRAIAIEKYVQEIANEFDDLISKIGAAVGA